MIRLSGASTSSIFCHLPHYSFGNLVNVFLLKDCTEGLGIYVHKKVWLGDTYKITAKEHFKIGRRLLNREYYTNRAVVCGSIR